jgi:predicted phosphohydrolase
MSIYAIGDIHLSFSCVKSMSIFGETWENYASRLEKNWNGCVCDGDSVIIVGDVSWGINLVQSLEDFKFINSLNGTKYLVKGNHDYWWNTLKKMKKWLRRNSLGTINFIHNNAYLCEGIILCGSRGWFVDEETSDDAEANQKILNRELIRLSLSIAEAKKIKSGYPDCEIYSFIHYPPVYGGYVCDEVIEILQKEEITACCYGHIHNAAESKIIRNYKNIKFDIVSADYLAFKPVKIR